MVKRKSIAGSDKRSRWQCHIEAWRQSGLSQRDYCQRNHLGCSQFSYWKKILKDEGVEDSLVFVPVPLANHDHAVIAPEDSVSNRSPELTVRLLSGIGVEIHGKFDSAVLTQIVVALGGKL